MADNYGKKFEQKFKEDFQKIPNSTIDRIYDTTNGYSHITNVSDFICYKYPNILYAEVKTTMGNTFPLSRLTQYDKLITKKDVFGAIAGVVIWYYEKEKVIFCSIQNVEQLKLKGNKSIHIEKDKDYFLEIPSVKKRVFMDSDYSIIFETWKSKYLDKNQINYL